MTVSITQEAKVIQPEKLSKGQSDGQPGNGVRGLFGIRNFRLLWFGETISLLGDQFYLIALPWLVLKLTGDAFAMGTVLALGGIPRALFMLVGGAVTDRFSPRNVMLVSNVLRLILTALLTVLVLAGQIQLWMIYVFALAFGLADAFFFPAQSAIVPRIVNKDQLEGANALTQGTAQLSLFAGPVLAGVMIALLGGGSTSVDGVPEVRGIAYAFLFDALTFVISAFTLWLMRTDQPSESDADTKDAGGVISAIRAGLLYVWNDVPLRIFFLLIAISNLLIMGPFIVGIPVLADTRLPEGAAAFGIIMSAFGGGSLLGIVLAGTLPRPPAKRMGVILGVIWSTLGVRCAAARFDDDHPAGGTGFAGDGRWQRLCRHPVHDLASAPYPRSHDGARHEPADVRLSRLTADCDCAGGRGDQCEPDRVLRRRGRADDGHHLALYAPSGCSVDGRPSRGNARRSRRIIQTICFAGATHLSPLQMKSIILLAFAVAFDLKVKAVEKAVEYRRYKNPHRNQENDPGKQRIKRCKQLTCIGLQGIDGTHPAQNHRRIQDRVDP